VVAIIGQIAVLAAAATVIGGWLAGLAVALLCSVLAWAFRSGLSDPAPRVRIPDSPAELDQAYYSG
jgi:hypothetical protein